MVKVNLVIISLGFVAVVGNALQNKYNSNMKSDKIKELVKMVVGAQKIGLPTAETTQTEVAPSLDNDFLKDIAMLETSGGKDLEHEMMKTGMHAKTKAVGMHGIMPNTAKELANRVKNRDPLLQLDQDFAGDKEIEMLAKEDPKKIQNVLESNPKVAERLANYMYNLVEARYKGDPEKMAYAWNMGHNTPEADITPEKLDKTAYVKRFRKLRQERAKKGNILP